MGCTTGWSSSLTPGWDIASSSRRAPWSLDATCARLASSAGTGSRGGPRLLVILSDRATQLAGDLASN